MKKLFVFLAVSGLVLSGVSCSSDDNTPPPPPPEKTLELDVDKNEVEVGETVTFTVKVDGKVESGAELYIDGKTKISGLETSFDASGVYSIMARKEGFKDSNSVVVNVTAPTPPEETNLLIGSWIPLTVRANVLGAPQELPYPKNENCEGDDTLEFVASATVAFKYHSENCELVTLPGTWSEDGELLVIELMGKTMEVDVKTNTETKLIIAAKASQFEPLIPILVPDLADQLPSELLEMIDIELELEKQ